MHRGSFPYQQKRIPHRTKAAVPLKNKGSEVVQMNPNAWISDGPVRPIEKGLPLTGTLPPALDPGKKTPIDNMVNILVERPYMKSLRKMYGGLMDKFPEMEFDDPNNLSAYEKQFIADNSHEEGQKIMKATTLKLSVPDSNGVVQTKICSHVPLNAHLYTFGGAIPYYESHVFSEDESIKMPIEKEKKVRTGIYGEKQPNQKDASSYIRDIHFDCLSKTEIEQELQRKDNPTQPVDVTVPKRVRARTSFSTIANKEENTIKGCLQTYFSPLGKPFVPVNVEKYFPMSLFEVDKIKNKSPNESNLDLDELENNTQRTLTILHPSEEMDPKSKLIDTSDEDVLFTKDRTLLRRSEIAEMRAFEKHWERKTQKAEKRLDLILKKRNKEVEKAFQSREVMKTYLKLLDEDCERISSGLIGKSPYKHKSMWEVALELTPKDPTSLGNRMEYWWRYAIFVREIGGIHDEFDNEVTQELRKLLMNNHSVDQSLFFDVLHNLRDECFSSVSSLKVIEFIRITFNIEQKQFQAVFEERRISQLIYSQTILTNMPKEQVIAMNQIANMKIEVPDVEELV